MCKVEFLNSSWQIKKLLTKYQIFQWGEAPNFPGGHKFCEDYKKEGVF